MEFYQIKLCHFYFRFVFLVNPYMQTLQTELSLIYIWSVVHGYLFYNYHLIEWYVHNFISRSLLTMQWIFKNNFLQASWTLWRGDGCLAFLVSPVICLCTVSEIRGCYKFLKIYQKITEFAKKHTLKSLWSNPHSHQNINKIMKYYPTVYSTNFM